jgi:DNA-directed RNA polymerase subunit RPC12/RpoP
MNNDVENITVFTESTDEKTIADLKEELQKVIAEKRPQGEWKLIANDTVNLEYIYKCSECGREVRVYNASKLTDIYPFCHCGADMRKGGAE